MSLRAGLLELNPESMHTLQFTAFLESFLTVPSLLLFPYHLFVLNDCVLMVSLTMCLCTDLQAKLSSVHFFFKWESHIGGLYMSSPITLRWTCLLISFYAVMSDQQVQVCSACTIHYNVPCQPFTSGFRSHEWALPGLPYWGPTRRWYPNFIIPLIAAGGEQFILDLVGLWNITMRYNQPQAPRACGITEQGDVLLGAEASDKQTPHFTQGWGRGAGRWTRARFPWECVCKDVLAHNFSQMLLGHPDGVASTRFSVLSRI